MSNTEQKIAFLVRHAADDMSLCEIVLNLIFSEPSEKQASVLEMFFVYASQSVRDYSMRIEGVVNIPQCWILATKNQEAVQMTIYMLSRSADSAIEFYQRLWDYLTDDERFGTVEAKTAALYNCLESGLLPWFYIDRTLYTEFDDKEPSETSGSAKLRDYAQIEYLADTNRLSALQRAAHILRCIYSKGTFAEQADILRDLIDYYEYQIERDVNYEYPLDE